MSPYSGRLRKTVVFAAALGLLFSIAARRLHFWTFYPRPYTAPADESAQRRCDELAGSPREPSRVGRGDRFARIQVTEALSACQAAVNAVPMIPHYQFLYGRALQAAGRQKDAYQEFEQAALGGNAAAMDHIGMMYEAGKGVPKSGADAYAWYLRAAQAGSADGMFHVGRLYLGGSSVPQSNAEALAWYLKAAKAGSAEGMDSLGYMYQHGLGIQQSYADAFRWFFAAAEAGSPSGMKDLGELYENGQGVLESDSDAVLWYRRAADGGDMAAMSFLGDMYRDGRGVPQSDADAVKWYSKSVAAGNAYGILKLKRVEAHLRGEAASQNNESGHAQHDGQYQNSGLPKSRQRFVKGWISP
jgi:TPR repeat protein